MLPILQCVRKTSTNVGLL